jgi:hypothetical protein
VGERLEFRVDFLTLRGIRRASACGKQFVHLRVAVDSRVLSRSRGGRGKVVCHIGLVRRYPAVQERFIVPLAVSRDCGAPLQSIHVCNNPNPSPVLLKG